MLDTLQNLLMIGTRTDPESPVWAMLAAGALAATALLRRMRQD